MKKWTGRRLSNRNLVACLLMATGCLVSGAKANLTFDVVALSATAGATVSSDGKTVYGATAATVITYSVNAHIYSSDPNVPLTSARLVSANGGIYSQSGPGLIRGDLTQINDPLFAFGPALNGIPFIDANGATQVGPTTGPGNFKTNSVGHIAYLAAGSQGIAGFDFRMGGGTYSVTDLNSATSSSIAFYRGATVPTNGNPLWFENGVVRAGFSGEGTIDVSAPLVVTTTVLPEPAILHSLLAVAALLSARSRR